MSAHALIEKSRSKKKPFKVTLVAANGEPLMLAQLFTTRLNCKKNLVSVMSAFSGRYISVVDKTSKEEKNFHLTPDGYEQNLS